MQVHAAVDESDIGRIRKGMRARIALDAYPHEPVDGTVFSILYEGRNVSNVITYGVKIKPLRTPPFFRSEMTASIGFIVGRKEHALLIPVVAVQESPSGGKQAMVPGPDERPTPRAIETGMESGEEIEIISGLRAGEKVILASGSYVPQQAQQSSPLSLKVPKASKPSGGNSSPPPGGP